LDQYRNWSVSKLYHPLTLFWHDAERERGFR
jgi:hypothetical protein